MAPPSNHFTFAAASSHVHGALARAPFAGAALVRYCLAAGAPPRRGTLALAVPVGTSKGGRRAVAVAAASAAPGAGDGDDLPPFAGAALVRYCLAAGAPPRRGTLALAVPVGASKGGRRVVAVAAAAAAPGGADGDDLPSDCERLVSAFRFEMQLFKMSQRSVAFLGEPRELLDRALDTARDCMPMMEYLIGKKAVDGDTYKELASAGQAVLVVEGQSNEGYIRVDALANAIEGLKLVGKVFFDGADLPRYTTPAVPLSGDDVYKKSYLPALINLFVVYYTALAWEAYHKYGYNPRASN